MDKVLKEAIRITEKQVFVPQKFGSQPKKPNVAKQPVSKPTKKG